MTDSVIKEQRSLNMSLIRSKETKLEIFIRLMLHKLGCRFTKNVKHLPGKPDIVLPKYKTVIFVHGCFWHQHAGCKRATMPKSKTDYWDPKLVGNVERDKHHLKNLNEIGWNVFTIWESETKNESQVVEKLNDFFSKDSLEFR